MGIVSYAMQAEGKSPGNHTYLVGVTFDAPDEERIGHVEGVHKTMETQLELSCHREGLFAFSDRPEALCAAG